MVFLCYTKLTQDAFRNVLQIHLTRFWNFQHRNFHFSCDFWSKMFCRRLWANLWLWTKWLMPISSCRLSNEKLSDIFVSSFESNFDQKWLILFWVKNMSSQVAYDMSQFRMFVLLNWCSTGQLWSLTMQLFH